MPSAPLISVQAPARPGGSLTRTIKLHALLFDLDGTLADTRPLMVTTLQRLLQQNRRTAKPDYLYYLAPQGYPAFLAPLGLNNQRQQYWQVYEEQAQSAALFPWALPLLQWLRDKGVRIGVVTALPTPMAHAIIAGAGGTSLVDVVVGANDAPAKPDPTGIQLALRQLGVEASAAAMVGDSPTDIQAGKSAGCLTIGVGWGFHPLLKLAEVGADITFHSGMTFDQWIRHEAHLFASKPSLNTDSLYPQALSLTQSALDCTMANALPVPTEACDSCGTPLRAGQRCGDCEQRASASTQWVAKVQCAWLYVDDSPLTKAIRAFKGVGMPPELDVAFPLGRLFLPYSFTRGTDIAPDDILAHPPQGLLVPVPTSSEARARRGYAPVEKMLTAFFAPLLGASVKPMTKQQSSVINHLGTHVDPTVLQMDWQQVIRTVHDSASGWRIANALEKVSDTELKWLGASDRATVAANAYRLSNGASAAIRGQVIYLVDDVVTTGVTINRCAEVLRQAGARAVYVIALARNYHLQRYRTDYRCPDCRRGYLRLRHRKSDSKPFYGCSRWRYDDPNSCKFTCEPTQLGSWERHDDHHLETSVPVFDDEEIVF